MEDDDNLLIITDIDGVLTEESLAHGFIDYLRKINVIDKEHGDLIDCALSEYKNGHISYTDAIGTIDDVYMHALAGRSKEEVDEYVSGFLQSGGFQPYDYAKDLVDMVQGHEADIVGYTAGAQRVVNSKTVLEGLGLERIYAPERFEENENGILVPKEKPELRHYKEDKFTELTQGHAGKTSAWGDKDNDAPALKLADIPVLFNNERMRSLANEEDWPFITEEDDVVEKMQKILFS